jgi:hypothetical protein
VPRVVGNDRIYYLKIADLMLNVRAPIELNEGVREFLKTQLGCDVARQAMHEAA